MLRIACVCLTFLSLAAVSGERPNYSIEDVAVGFEKKNLFYYEVLFDNGKYLKMFNKCLSSRPAELSWMRKYCKKKPELTNAFECSEDAKKITHAWFIYETTEKCEEVRMLIKERMDALQ